MFGRCVGSPLDRIVGFDGVGGLRGLESNLIDVCVYMVRQILKAESGDTVRAGVLDAGRSVDSVYIYMDMVEQRTLLHFTRQSRPPMSHRHHYPPQD